MAAKRIWRAASIALLAPGLALLIYSGTIWEQYRVALPRIPNQTNGRIYPLNVHGIVVFQSLREKRRLDVVEEVAFGLFFLGLLVGGLEERYWNRTARSQA